MKKICRILIMFFFACEIASAESIEIIYPNRDGMGEKAFGYQLLQLIMPKTGKNYVVRLAKEPSNQDRALSELENGKYSVVDTGIGAVFEERFDAVYIPIDKGLTGWRIFIINAKQKNDFSNIKTIEERLKTNLINLPEETNKDYIKKAIELYLSISYDIS